MTLLRLTPRSREALHDHLYYGAVTFALLVLGSATSALLGLFIRAGVL